MASMAFAWRIEAERADSKIPSASRDCSFRSRRGFEAMNAALKARAVASPSPLAARSRANQEQLRSLARDIDSLAPRAYLHLWKCEIRTPFVLELLDGSRR
jgi:hypothetical protein